MARRDPCGSQSTMRVRASRFGLAVISVTIAFLAGATALEMFPPSTEAVLRSMSNSRGVSETCRRHIDLYQQELSLTVFAPFWAIKMFDASGKFPDGLSDGNTNAEGHARSCREIRVHMEVDDGVESFGGRFCATRAVSHSVDEDVNSTVVSSVIVPPLISPLAAQLNITDLVYFGLCVPDSCSEEDVSLGLKAMLDSFVEEREYDLIILSAIADSDTYDMEAKDWVFASVMIIFGALLLISSVTDFVALFTGIKLPSNLLIKAVMCFSVYANAKKILNTEKREGSSQLYCLNGLRWLSITWVMIGHSYSYALLMVPWNNMLDLLNPGPVGFLFRVIRNGLLSVDTFFFLSGLLVTYITFKELDSLKKAMRTLTAKTWVGFWAMFYIHRYIRLSGTMLIVMGFHATLGKFLIEGRTANFLNMFLGDCRENILWNALYLNNFVHPYNQCLPQTWFLAVDMQIFLVTPLIVFPLWRYKKAGKIALVAWIVASILVVVIETIVYQWPPHPEFTLDGEIKSHYNQYNYYAPWCRAQPYLVGVFVGYVIHIAKNKRLNIPYARVLNILGWLAATAIGIGVVYGLDFKDILVDCEEPSQVVSVFYGGFHRFAWGVALGWVVLSCVFGYGGVVNAVLSWEAFMPLARLQYITYLIHMTVLALTYNQFYYGMEFNHLTVAILFLFIVVAATVVSFVLVLAFEAPILNLEKLLLTPAKANKKTS